MTVREKLKRLRNDLGLSQERFGEALNLNKYPDYEYGHLRVPPYVIDSLERLYGIDPEVFADESNDIYLPPGGLPERKKKTPERRRPRKTCTIDRNWPRMPKRCNTCFYRVEMNRMVIGCGYAAEEGNGLRGCPAGDECTRYKPDDGQRRQRMFET